MRLLIRPLSPERSNSRRGHVTKTQRCKLPDHVFVVRCGPVDTPAARTLYKARLRGKNVLRHAVLDLHLGYGDNWLVAPGTARESVSEGIDLKGSNHLPQLVAEMVALNVKQRDTWRRAQQAAVAGQDRSALGPRMAQQRLAGEVCSVRGVLSDDAQPRGQAAQHLVDGESMDHGTPAMPART
jgi:hypothetical protein